MTLENNIENIVTEYMGSGKIEEKVNEYMDKAVESAVKDLFTGYKAPVETAISDQLKSVMIPVIEKYDYSKYIVKLDKILVEVLEKTTFENRSILENFKSFVAFDNPENINISELFEKWCEYVSAHIDTSNLEIDYDDRPTYESPVCTMEVTDESDYSWSSIKHKIVTFACDRDEDMNVSFVLTCFSKISEKWELSSASLKDISSLRSLNSFEIFLINLNSFGTKIELDEEFLLEDHLEIEARPEAEFY